MSKTTLVICVLSIARTVLGVNQDIWGGDLTQVLDEQRADPWAGCKPWRWERKRGLKRVLKVGDINCRYTSRTYADVNYYTCKELADKHGTSVEHFFWLNPGLDKDCKNIKPHTEYCTVGWPEPLRAWDGKCGPPNKNATCVGTMFQCCNAETWTCGDKIEDCQPGACYAGACHGGDEYTLDGKHCGNKHGGRKCGKWGDCCNFDGICGNGTDFCGAGKCESGLCTDAPYVLPLPEKPGELPWQTGDTPDGTCGGEHGYTCDVVWGNCCSKDGRCGSLREHCGPGCQSEFGTCRPDDTLSTSSSSTYTSSASTLSPAKPRKKCKCRKKTSRATRK